MKNSTLFLLLIGVNVILSAQSPIIVQNGSESYLYASLDSAVAAAPAGSYIYLAGATYELTEDLIIDKPLYIIGAGHDPATTPAIGRTKITGAIRLITGADGGSMEGFSLQYFYVGTSSSDNDVNGYMIRRLHVYGALSLSYFGSGTANSSNARNFLIKDCVLIGPVYGADAGSIQFFNNFFDSGIYSFEGNQVVFKNNFFLGPPFGNSFQNVNYVVFQNNIFTSSAANYFYFSSNNSFFNNITTSNSFPDAAVSEGNIFSQNISSLFVDQTGNDFNYGDDYRLAPGSVAIGAGMDGADIGVYGGAEPYKEGAAPRNPLIEFSQINSTTNPNGTLPVHIRVRAQNN